MNEVQPSIFWNVNKSLDVNGIVQIRYVFMGSEGRRYLNMYTLSLCRNLLTLYPLHSI